jgi:hypothetical protein
MQRLAEVNTTAYIPLKQIGIFVNCSSIVNRWQYYSTHLHTKTIDRTTQIAIEQHK